MTHRVPDGTNGSVEATTSFEELTARLEEVLQLLERGDLPLNAALESYERGVALVRECNDLLDRAELRISELSGDIRNPGPSRSSNDARGSLFDLDQFNE